MNRDGDDGGADDLNVSTKKGQEDGCAVRSSH